MPDTAALEAGRDDAPIAWTFTLVTVVPCFAYILALALVPGALARPVVPGSLVSVGLVVGLALAVFLAAMAAIYTYVMNRRERA